MSPIVPEIAPVFRRVRPDTTVSLREVGRHTISRGFLKRLMRANSGCEIPKARIGVPSGPSNKNTMTVIQHLIQGVIRSSWRKHEQRGDSESLGADQAFGVRPARGPICAHRSLAPVGVCSSMGTRMVGVGSLSFVISSIGWSVRTLDLASGGGPRREMHASREHKGS